MLNIFDLINSHLNFMGSINWKRTPVHCHLITLGIFQGIMWGLCKIPSYHATFFNCNEEEELLLTFFTCCAFWFRNAKSFKRWYNFESLAWLYNFELHGMSVLPYLKESYSVYNSSELQVPHVNDTVTLKMFVLYLKTVCHKSKVWS